MMKIDWFLTRKCDQICRFCNAPWNVFPQDVSTERALQIADRLKQVGVQTVTICGGEPFMFAGLEAVVHCLANLGIKIVLYTSATSLHRANLFGMLTDLHILSFPVDAVTLKYAAEMRGIRQVSEVSALLQRLSRIRDCPPIKIGTVVTKQNISDILHIYHFLLQFKEVKVWRLYQFSPYGIGKRNQARFLLFDEDFTSTVKLAKEHNESLGAPIHIAERSLEDMYGSCMIMDSQGGFWRYEGSYIPLGVTVFEDPCDIIIHYDLNKHVMQKSWHNLHGALYYRV